MEVGISIFANISMARVLHIRNYGVYVNDERGTQHHLPHAHIKNRGARIASVFLITLTVFNEEEPVPADVLEFISTRIGDLLAEWERLNS